MAHGTSSSSTASAEKLLPTCAKSKPAISLARLRMCINCLLSHRCVQGDGLGWLVRLGLLPPSWYLVGRAVGREFRFVQTIRLEAVGIAVSLRGELGSATRARNRYQPLTVDKSPHLVSGMSERIGSARAPSRCYCQQLLAPWISRHDTAV